VSGNDDAVSLLDAFDGSADFFDDAEGFVADDSSFDAAHAAFVEVKIGAADSCRRDTEQDVGGLHHLGIGNFAHCDAACFFENHGFHRHLVLN
jgi:hypothetical protein